MKSLLTIATVLGLLVVRVPADMPAPPRAYVTAGPWGEIYFKMLPSAKDRWNQRDGQGIAYRVRADGPDEELWRTEGWYSFEIFLSHDGRHLVAMGPWNSGNEPSKEDLAVAFYRDGKLLKQYSTAELVKDRSKVSRSISHYRWLARDSEYLSAKKDPEAQLRLSWENTFRLKTCDGIVYEFDVTNGEIKKKST